MRIIIFIVGGMIVYGILLGLTIFMHVVYRKFFTDQFKDAQTISQLSFPKGFDNDGYNFLDTLTLIPFTLPLVTIGMIFALISKLIGNIPLTSKKNPLMSKFDKVDQKFR